MKMKLLEVLLVGVLLTGSAQATLVLTIDNYTTDEITFSISGTLDADTIGDQPGWIAVKNDWSNYYGLHTEWFSGAVEPTITANTMTIGGITPTQTRAVNTDVSYTDSFYFVVAPGSSILAGTSISGSATLSSAGGFNPSDASTLQLLSGFNDADQDWTRLEGVSVVPEPATASLVGIVAFMMYAARRRLLN